MINHARTLLINKRGEASFDTIAGEEIVPPDFAPVILASAIQKARSVIFGSEPDKHMLNYRARQLMSLLHTPDLEEFVTDLDARITYDLEDDPYFDESLFVPSIKRMEGVTNELMIVGDATVERISGKMRRVWEITVTTGTYCTVKMLTPTLQQTTPTYTISSGISSLMTIPGTGMQFRIRDGVGAKWYVELLTRPQNDLGSVMASLDQVGDDTLADLFRVGNPLGSVEPRLTFRNLWNDHFDLPHRLGGLVLALIYYTEDLRV